MAVQRVQVEAYWTDSLPRDSVVNVLHFVTDAGWTGHQALADSINAAFKTLTPFSTRGFKVKVYDLANAKPRPVKAEKIVAPSVAMASSGNRDVALCLSFYATRNLPRQRGRIYLGPWGPTEAGTNRPSTTILDYAQSLPPLFAAAGGSGCTWAVYSPTMASTGSPGDAAAGPVTNWYVDDEWDTQRRRGAKATSRRIGTTTG